nr:nucleic acid binding protein [Hymenolepis microstoma]
MPRDRSRSPASRRKRSKSRSRDRHRDRHDRDYDRHRRVRDGRRDEDRYRRDRTPDRGKRRRRRDSSEEYRDKDYRGGKPRRDDRSCTPESPDPAQEATSVEDKEVKEPQTEEEKQMMKMLGFFNFDSTKGKHVTGNNVYVANIQKKRKYRQYMNRRGGFNRKLDPIT